MPDVALLQTIMADPKSTVEERAQAERELAALPVQKPDETADPQQSARQQAEKELLHVAGVTALEWVTASAVIRFVETQPKLLSKDVSDLLSFWHVWRSMMTIPDPTVEVWEHIVANFPETERRAEFQRVVHEHPYLDIHPSTLQIWRDELKFWEGLSTPRTVHETLVYYLPSLRKFADRLPVYAFATREAAEALIKKWEAL